jgi:truncated hemoglobin YjbI
MQSVKEMARELIEHLPDTATFDDLIYEFYVRQKIETGLKAVNEGRTISHDEAKKRYAIQVLEGALAQQA